MSCLNLQRALAIGFLIFALAYALTGCSALSSIGSALPVGKGVEATAQVGAENVKQGVGVNNKTDTSSKQDTSIKDSKVDSVDTSSKKKVNTSSISAETITADRIEIRSDDGSRTLIALVILFSLLLVSVAVIMKLRSKK